MTARSAYRGRTVAFATMHGKERLARGPFHDILGCHVVAPAGLDTDQLGTFTGEIPRTLPPLQAARTKARLGMTCSGTVLGLASEGSFGTAVGGFGSLEHLELLVFLDEDRGLDLVESAIIAASPIPPGRTIRTRAEALAFADEVGFPRQGVIVSGVAVLGVAVSRATVSGDPDRVEIRKDVTTLHALADTVDELLAGPTDGVRIEADLRAHACPARAATIAELAERMARRLATRCPDCGTPGFGVIDVEHGAPCRRCLAPTAMIAAEVLGCGGCPRVDRRYRTPRLADPRWCDACNP